MTDVVQCKLWIRSLYHTKTKAKQSKQKSQQNKIVKDILTS